MKYKLYYSSFVLETHKKISSLTDRWGVAVWSLLSKFHRVTCLIISSVLMMGQLPVSVISLPFSRSITFISSKMDLFSLSILNLQIVLTCLANKLSSGVLDQPEPHKLVAEHSM